MAYLLSELAEFLDLELIGNPNASIDHVAGLDQAGAHAISFYTGVKHKQALLSSQAGAVILSSEAAALFDGNKLVSGNPYACYARIAQQLHPRSVLPAGIHASACIDNTARIHPSAYVGQNVIVEADTDIGEDCQIGAGVYIGQGVIVGHKTVVFANATLHQGTRVGRCCLIHSGAVLGSDGFGHARDGASWIFIPQLGNVLLGDDVTVGANTAIDRGTLGDTLIGNGVKLDNLVHIAHNVQIGDDTAIAGQCGIAGSTRIGSRCTFAGQVGVADNLEICDDAHFTGQAAVRKSVNRPGVYSSGILLDETTKWSRNALRFNQLDTLFKQVKGLLKGVSDNKSG